jgi:hypothetical protein
VPRQEALLVRRSTHRPSALLIALFAALAIAPPASAAMCARWDRRTGVVALGSPVPVSFRTYVPTAKRPDDLTLKPWAFPEYPFRVRALSPEGKRSTVPVARGLQHPLH